VEINDLYRNLKKAYTSENLHQISARIIDMFREHQYDALRAIQEVVNDYQPLQEDSVNRIFSRLIMLYHPDRLEHALEKMENAYRNGDFETLFTLSHILTVQNLEPESVTVSSILTDEDLAEEFGWDAYRPTIPEGEHHWKRPMMIPAKLDEVDHIIYLPRVSSHILAGKTLGFKLAVGFLRSDSRGDFHKGGKYFYAMYEEINHVPPIASKLRLTVSSGRSVLTLVGPNEGPTAKPDHGLVLASEDLLAHEMLAYAWLQWNRQFETSSITHMTMGKPTKSRSRYNKRFSDRMWPDKDGRETPAIDYFEPGNLYNHPDVVNYLKRMGGRPRIIAIEEINKQPDSSVIDYLKRQLKS